MDSLGEMDKLLGTYNLATLNQKKQNMNRPITSDATESIIFKKIPNKQKARDRWLHSEFNQT